jgi:hypothetical protein
MNTDEQAEYIHRRIKRALAFKAFRDLRKTVDAMEAEEKAAQLTEHKIVAGIWIVIFLVFFAAGAGIRFIKTTAAGGSSEHASTQTSAETPGSIIKIPLSQNPDMPKPEMPR